MSAITRASREQELLRYLRQNPSRLRAEYRRVLELPDDLVLAQGTPGAALIMAILDREFACDASREGPLRKSAIPD